MDLMEKTYTRAKMYRLKMIDSPDCQTCPSTIEDRKHLYEECPRAKEVWKIYNEVKETDSIHETNKAPSDINGLNLYSLAKAMIHGNREQPLDPNIVKTRLENRKRDLESIRWRKLKELRDRKKHAKVKIK